MLTILETEHLLSLNSQILPLHSFIEFLTQEFNDLADTLHHDPQEPFSLEKHGHRMVVLEPSDNYRSLPIFGHSVDELDLMESVPEYVELIQRPEGFSIYRICFLFDNECFLLMYIISETLDPKLDRWLSEQTGPLGGSISNV